jgi:hypothetical protein
VVIGSVCLLNPQLNTYILSIVLIVECGIVIEVGRRSAISFEDVSYGVCFFDLLTKVHVDGV